MKKIRNTLLIFYLTPVLLLQIVSGFFFYTITKNSLDEELGARLKSISSIVASQIREIEIQALQALSHGSEMHQSLKNKLIELQKSNELSSIYILQKDGKTLVDTNSDEIRNEVLPQIAIHEMEIAQVIQGQTVASVLFKGSDGLFYKSAFAPIMTQGKVIALIGVDASVSFFKNLHLLTKVLMYFALSCIVVVLCVSLLISSKIVKPLEELSQIAKDIGYGQMSTPIVVRSDNELALLGKAMEDMRTKILARDQELNLMLQGIAHEVRNPLGGMELFSGLLLEDLDKEPHKGYVVRIQKEIQNLKKLVEEFLDYAKGLFPDKREIHLLSLVSEVRDYFLSELTHRKIHLHLECDPHVRVMVDIDQMKRAISNLVKNAIQASSENANIWIKAFQDNQGFCLSVKDEGIGIPKENMSQLFEPFYTTKEKGSGLGLSFVQKIIQAHHGKLEVFSTAGQGTEFKIYV